MYENVSMEEYLKLNSAQRKNVKKAKLFELLELQLTKQNVSDVGVNELREIISDVVKDAVVELKDEINGYRQEVSDLKDQLKDATNETNILKKVVSEQQKFLEWLKRDKVKDNIFISGIPNTLDIGGDNTEDNDKIVHHILTFVEPNIVDGDYRVIKNFEPRQGYLRHSCLLGFTNTNAKKNILQNSKKLNGLQEDNVLRKVFIKNEQTPLTRKENSRIYGEFKKLKELHEADESQKVKLEKGKLYLNDEVVDEFNLSNQLF